MTGKEPETPRKSGHKRRRHHQSPARKEPPAKAASLDPNVSAMLEGMKGMQQMMASAMQMFCAQQAQVAGAMAVPGVLPVQPGMMRPVSTGPPSHTVTTAMLRGTTEDPSSPSLDSARQSEAGGVPVNRSLETQLSGAPVQQDLPVTSTEVPVRDLPVQVPVLPGPGTGPVNTGQLTDVPDTEPVNAGETPGVPAGPTGVAIVAEGAPVSLVPVRSAGQYEPVVPAQVPVDPDKLVSVRTGSTEETTQAVQPLPTARVDLPAPLRDDVSERGDSLLDEEEETRMDWALQGEDPALPLPSRSASDDALTESLAAAAQRQLTVQDPPTEVKETGSLFRRTREQIMNMLCGTLTAPPLPSDTKRRALSVVTMEGPAAQTPTLEEMGMPFSPYVDEMFRSADKELRGTRSHQSLPTAKALPKGKLLRRTSATVSRYGIPEEIYDPKATQVDVEWEDMCRWMQPIHSVPISHLERFEEDARQMVAIGSYLDVSSAASLEITRRLLASDNISEPIKDWLNLNLQIQAARGMAIEHLIRIAVTNEANLRLERRDACLAASNLSASAERTVRCAPLLSNYLFGGSLADVAKRVLTERQEEATATTQKALVDIAGAFKKVAKAKSKGKGSGKSSTRSFAQKRLEKAKSQKHKSPAAGHRPGKSKKTKKPRKDRRPFHDSSPGSQ